MSASARTPESLLPRSDSKNPATTCKGITSSGRPCRRSLAANPKGSPAVSPSKSSHGVLAVLSATDDEDSAAAFYCWQHKDQAASLAASGQTDGRKTDLFPLKERNSIDTLAERLGVLEVDDGPSAKPGRRGRKGKGAVRRETLPKQWQSVPGPLMSVSAAATPGSGKKRPPEVHFSFFCCMRAPLKPTHNAPQAVPRPRPATDNRPPQNTSSLPQSMAPIRPVSSSPKPSPAPMPGSTYKRALLSFIPSSVTEPTRTLLLAELSKPLTRSDMEPGYIYIYWLTPTSAPQPGRDEIKMVLSPKDKPSKVDANGRVRGRSDIARSYSVKATNRRKSAPDDDPPTLMIKIGRASNVHRRMGEWERQCGQRVTLARVYPHRKGERSPSGSPSRSSHRLSAAAGRDAGRSAGHGRRSSDHNLSPSPSRQMDDDDALKVPLVNRVERLVHVELAEKRVMKDCDGCGKMHREWFEIAATREAVAEVDAVVKRWVSWAEGEG